MKYFIIALFLMSGLAHAKIRGPWIGGGGGEGLVCFASVDARDQAFEASGRIRPEARAQIVELRMYDLAESTMVYGYGYPTATDNVYTYIERIISTQIAPHGKYLALRFHQALELLVNADGSLKWKRAGALDKLDDSGEVGRPVRELNFYFSKHKRLYCDKVQLATRRQRPSVQSVFPEVEVDFDVDLFERLGARGVDRFVNQAALVLHEIVYLMGSEVGMKDSSRSRDMVRALLMGDGSSLNMTLSPKILNLVQTIVFNMALSDFMHMSVVFLDRDLAPYSLESLRQSYATLERKSYDLGLNFKLNKDTRAQRLKSLSLLATQVNLEESFLWFTEYSYVNKLTTVERDTLLLAPAELEKRELCRSWRLFRSAFTAGANDHVYQMWSKAIQYCDALTFTK